MQIVKDPSLFRHYVIYVPTFPFAAGVITTVKSFTLELVGDWHFTVTPISGTAAEGVQGNIWDKLLVSIGVIDRTPSVPGDPAGASGLPNLVGPESRCPY